MGRRIGGITFGVLGGGFNILYVCTVECVSWLHVIRVN